MNESSFFLVFEGLDGSGKSAISDRLAAHLSEQLGDAHVLHTFEPHDPSAAGEYVRAVLKKKIKVSTRTLALGFALNRADHNERVIAPFLEAGEQRVVICDRYWMSSLVYQSSNGLTIEDVAMLNAGARSPDLTLFLDASPETCYERMGSRGGVRELYEERLTETRQKYFSVIDWLRGRGERIEVVDANGDFDAVFAGVTAAVRAYAPDWLARA